MKRLILAAALVAAGFAVPVLPAAAAEPLLSDSEVNCLIFPVLKKECWEKGAELLKATPKTVAAATESAATTLKLPTPLTCTRAPEGSGHLFDC